MLLVRRAVVLLLAVSVSGCPDPYAPGSVSPPGRSPEPSFEYLPAGSTRFDVLDLGSLRLRPGLRDLAETWFDDRFRPESADSSAPVRFSDVDSVVIAGLPDGRELDVLDAAEGVGWSVGARLLLAGGSQLLVAAPRVAVAGPSTLVEAVREPPPRTRGDPVDRLVASWSPVRRGKPLSVAFVFPEPSSSGPPVADGGGSAGDWLVERLEGVRGGAGWFDIVADRFVGELRLETDAVLDTLAAALLARFVGAVVSEEACAHDVVVDVDWAGPRAFTVSVSGPAEPWLSDWAAR